MWESLDATMGQPCVNPLAEWERLAEYRLPDPRAPGRLAQVPAQLDALGDKFLKFGLGITGFNQATFLRGFEALLMDLSLEPARAARVLDMVFGFENALIEQVGGICRRCRRLRR